MTPFDPSQLDWTRRAPRSAEASGQGPPILTPAPMPQQPGAEPSSASLQPNAAPQTTLEQQFGPEQLSLLGQLDPNFLIDYANRQGNPGEQYSNPSFDALNQSMGTPWAGQDTGFRPQVTNQYQLPYGMQRPPMPPSPGQWNAPGLGMGGQSGGQLTFPRIAGRLRAQGYGAGGGYGGP